MSLIEEPDFGEEIMRVIDIHNREFSRRFNGYDTGEVREFLQEVGRNYEVLRNKYFDLLSQIKREPSASADAHADLMSPETIHPVQKPTPLLPAEQPPTSTGEVVSRLRETLSLIETKDELQSEIKKLEERRRSLEQQIDEREAYLDSLSHQIHSSERQLRQIVEQAQDILRVKGDGRS